MKHEHHLSHAQLRLRRDRRRLLPPTSRPSLHLYRSCRYHYAQIIDDLKRCTLLSVSEKELDASVTGTKTQKAIALGELMAKKAKTKKITQVSFDRGGYQYHGRIKAFAQSARENGLSF